jgi:hypothetical protein
MAGSFIALCNENEEAPLVVIAGRETFVISLLTRIGYGGQFVVTHTAGLSRHRFHQKRDR